MPRGAIVLAYCGAPPLPAEIWSHWRLNPVVLLVMFGWLAIYLVGARRTRGAKSPIPARKRVLFVSGWAIATLALVSPLCPLSVSLFAARATQHVLLILFAAPLIAASEPLAAARALFNVSWKARMRPRERPMLAAAVFAVFLWIWHSPLGYASTFASVTLYWAMHLSLFASACWLWSSLLRTEGALGGGLLASIASSVQMGILGALITLSPRPFYAPHFLTTDAWGFTPLQDQQLGGVIMWVPGCTVFLIVAMIALARCFARLSRVAAPLRSDEAVR